METLTGTGTTISDTVSMPQDHIDKRTAASLKTTIQTLLNSVFAIKTLLNDVVMKEGEDVALLGSDSAPGADYVPTSDGADGLVWTALNTVSGTIDRQPFSSAGDWELIENSPLWTADIAGGVLSLFIESGESPNYGAGYYDGPRGRYIHSADPFNCDVYARLVSFTVPTAGNSNAICYMNTSSETSNYDGYGVGINSNGDVFGINMFNETSSAQAGFPLDGTGWIRVSKKGSIAAAYWGIGTAESMPTSWTYLGSRDTGIALLTHVTLAAKHWSTGSATDSTFVWDDCVIVDGTIYPTL